MLNPIVDGVSEVFKLSLDILELISCVLNNSGRALVDFDADLLDQLFHLSEPVLSFALHNLELPLNSLLDYRLLLMTCPHWCLPLIQQQVSQPLRFPIITQGHQGLIYTATTVHA